MKKLLLSSLLSISAIAVADYGVKTPATTPSTATESLASESSELTTSKRYAMHPRLKESASVATYPTYSGRISAAYEPVVEETTVVEEAPVYSTTATAEVPVTTAAGFYARRPYVRPLARPLVRDPYYRSPARSEGLLSAPVKAAAETTEAAADVVLP